jgi:hypothetical protein
MLDDDYGDPHDDCVSVDDVVSYALENNWNEVEEAVSEFGSKEWLSRSKPCLELLSILSQRDSAHMRGAMKKWLRKKQNDAEAFTEEKLFSIASDVSAFIEQLQTSFPLPPVLHDIGPSGYQGMHEPSAARCIGFSGRACNLLDDIVWAKDLLVVSRAFRDILSAISDPELVQPYLNWRITEPVKALNSYLRKTPAQFLIYWREGDKQLKFGRCPDPEFADLSSYIANWISDYLNNHHEHVKLGVCSECGKIFIRERRDKTLCSKTCQNRLAYQRRKILESDALGEINISPDDACDIVAGLWMHHPRFGIGLVEGVNTPKRSAVIAGLSAVDEVRYRSTLSKKTILQVRFLHGVRMLGYSDLFENQKKEDQIPKFYKVNSEETLAELL